MQSLLLRLLVSFPPGKMSFIFIDPVGLGANVAPFMHLSDHDEKLIRDQVWVEEQDIKQRLVELTDHIALVHQKYLRNQYATIEEYNRDAGEIAEPYRFLVVVDFPVNFGAEAGRRLISIIQKGSQCGVYSIILNDFSKPLPPASSFNINDFYQAMRVLTVRRGGVEMEWPETDFKDCSLELESPPDTDLFNRIVHQVGEDAKNNSKVEVPFDKVLERANLQLDQWWQGNTIDGIQVPMGPSGARKIQHLEIGQETAQHVLMIGMTNSGKSTLFHVLITTLALKYSPDELELYLIDFKKGVEFKVYATAQLPHARVIAIESEREFGLSVLEGLDAELNRRGDMFRQAMAQNLASYRKNTQYSLPRVLLLVDEFQEFFSEEDTLASKVTQILDRLVREGRAFGIHILMGSQTLATSGIHTLKRGIIDQMGIRIALQCGDQDSRTILDVNNDAAKLLSRPGEAIYNAKNGLVEGNNPFQVAWLPNDLQRQYLREIEKLARQVGHYPPKLQVVFEGNAPVNMETHHGLNELLTNPRPMISSSLLAWLGEPVALKEVTTTQFRRQSENNLMIVGQNEEAALSTLLASVLTLSAYQAPQTAKFYILDCFNPIDSSNAYWFTQLSNSSRQQIKLGLPRQLPEMFKEIVMEMNLRLEKIKTHSSLSDQSTIYLIIYGLQRARDLEADNPPSYAKPNDSLTPAKQWLQILHEGPDLGIHSVVWCDTVSNFKRRMGQPALREFGMRILFQMSEEDSNSLMGNKSAGKLGQHRALFYDPGNNQIEKFRPFALPSMEWLNRVLGRPSQQTESSRGGEAENIFWRSKGR